MSESSSRVRVMSEMCVAKREEETKASEGREERTEGRQCLSFFFHNNTIHNHK